MHALAMAACNAAKDSEAALRLFGEAALRLKCAGDGTDESTSSAGRLDTFIYAQAIRACAHTKEWERAIDLLGEMESVHAGSTLGAADAKGYTLAWNHAMVACNRGGQPDKALELYDRMRAGACTPTEHSITAALVACRARDADWMRAEAIFDGHKAITASSDMALSALLDVFADGEKWTLLLSYFDAAKASRQLGSLPYEKAIEACDRVDPARSVELLDELRAQL